MEDWRTPFMEYLAQGILPTDRTLAHQLKKLVVRYFLQNGIVFKKGYNEDPLRCLRPKEAREVVREVHSDDYWSHPGKRRLYKQLLLLGYYWPTMKKDSEELVKTCHACPVLGDAIHTHLSVLQDMMTPWPFHTWGAWFYKAYKPSFQWLHMNPSSHQVLYKIGRKYSSEKGHWSNYGKLHSRTHHYKVWDPQEVDQWQWDPVHKQIHEEPN